MEQKTKRCINCRNALYIGKNGRLNVYMCSKSLNIKSDCDMYQEGMPRDGRFSLTSSVNLKDIRSGIGTLENQKE